MVSFRTWHKVIEKKQFTSGPRSLSLWAKELANKMNCPSFPFLQGSLSFVCILLDCDYQRPLFWTRRKQRKIRLHRRLTLQQFQVTTPASNTKLFCSNSNSRCAAYSREDTGGRFGFEARGSSRDADSFQTSYSERLGYIGMKTWAGHSNSSQQSSKLPAGMPSRLKWRCRVRVWI